tara:strand:+ start:2845 stop:3459 length:615 start_codon:yes stop_codon:yes gene_type:complete
LIKARIMSNSHNYLPHVRLVWLAFVLVFSGIQGASAENLDAVASKVIESDPRNKGIEIAIFESGSELHFCVNNIRSTHSPMDVFRTFLQSAVELKDQNYTAVNLCFRGEDQFILGGDEFRVLGEDYGTQNPAYTIRTFPEKLTDMSGQSAYPKRDGGLLYLLRVQMEDFRDMHSKWYLNELLAEIKADQDAQRPKNFAPDEEVF